MMAKKTAKKSKKASSHVLKMTAVIFSAILLVIGFTVYFKVKAQSYCANSISCIQDLSGKPSTNDRGEFMGQKTQSPVVPSTPEFAMNNARSVLGDSTPDQKHIYVDLGHQRLYAYNGTTLAYNFPVSTGKWHPTPTGDFRIWIWLRDTRMVGGNKSLGTYYNLPNVPYTMYFSSASVPRADGYSLHGAYWHNNFGHPMSHGCVNLRPSDAEQIFYWTNPTVQWVARPTAEDPGTLITIYGKPPASETAFID